jgi:hypothetical protein
MLLKSLSAERTGYSGDTLRANASGIHNPENAELLGANGTRGNKLIGHEALSSQFPLTLEVGRQQLQKSYLSDARIIRLA